MSVAAVGQGVATVLVRTVQVWAIYRLTLVALGRVR
jgi:hypothetical protein